MVGVALLPELERPEFAELAIQQVLLPDFPGAMPITLDVAPGEVVAVLGEPGAGKTAFLRVVAGLDQARAGTVTVAGRDVSNLPPGCRAIGYVHANPGATLPPFRRVREIVASPFPGPRSRAVDSDLVDSVAQLVGDAIIDYPEAYPLALSRLDQFRVAVARNLVRHPLVLLVDSALDALPDDDRRESARLIRRLGEQGLAVLVATADPRFAAAAARKVVVLDRGRSLQTGSLAGLRGAPSSQRVLEIVGATDVAFLSARVTVSNLVETSDGTKLGWAVPGVVVSAGQRVEVALDSAHLTVAADEAGPLRAEVAQIEHLPGNRHARVVLTRGATIVVTYVLTPVPLRIAQPVSLGFTDPPLLFDTATRSPIGRLIPGNWTGNRSA